MKNIKETLQMFDSFDVNNLTEEETRGLTNLLPVITVLKNDIVVLLERALNVKVTCTLNMINTLLSLLLNYAE
ncbi:hypothetical protein [Paenibacillus sp. RC21]|uniref:hypothetical protein n=1 Tax=Paenibacillus sp. RC21 TaxID=3156312 RepID=UPI0038323E0E